MGNLQCKFIANLTVNLWQSGVNLWSDIQMVYAATFQSCQEFY